MRYNNKNVILPEPWVQPGPANDEIWYTSSDGNTVKPYSTSALPSIVSNTYSDGKGIIKFASDVTSIGGQAFWNIVRLIYIEIPNSVTIIGERAFSSCKHLTSISYTGTISQWNAITKGYMWNVAVPAKVVHCTDGDVAI